MGPALAWHPTVSADLLRVAEESDGELSLETLRDALERQEARLWLVSSAGRYAGVVVEERSRGRLNLVAVRLRYNALAAALNFFGRIATESGLRLVAFSRRPGMRRLLGRYGWTPTAWAEYQAP